MRERQETDDEVADALLNLSSHPLGGGTDVRVSLGGVQQKLIVTRASSGTFGGPLGGAPSTHLIKPGTSGWIDIVANEAFCLRIARCCGLTTARVETALFEDTPCLVVERFDRTLTDDVRITRLRQLGPKNASARARSGLGPMHGLRGPVSPAS